MRVKAELLSSYSGTKLAAEKSELSSKRTKRRRRRPGWMPPVIQQLFDTCKAVFSEGKSGFVLSKDEVARIQSILDQMKPADVGISPKLPYFRNVDAVTLSSGEQLARLKTDTVFTAPCETSILYPDSGGNMHCFTAKTACAVLDVFVPPYSVPERNCTYYHDYSYTKCAGRMGFIGDL
ncbi:hypothetical protein HPP92_009507 [Vanilla planifolia]|uniref:cysteine dioxygenase n=1 Tax=Vanilla planifolia TaxID=51239 RepID=A0A835RJX6_VANPL|nr:hypothetical protein HPP92_009507 [Vanilla planifolia]